MSPVLLTIYGPIAIHSFGLMIAIGLLITLYFLHKDLPLQKLISYDQLMTIVHISFIAGLAGGRIWFLLTNPHVVHTLTDAFAIWSGGLSILGAIIGVAIALPIYLYYQHVPILPTLDRLALYTPLLQSIARLGCFFAGCCYGKVTTMPWGVVYTDHASLAPLWLTLHPTQLYSSIFLAGIFLVLCIFSRYYPHHKHGQILALYIMLMSMERFLIDYLRADQDFYITTPLFGPLSIQQILAFCLFTGACILMTFIRLYPKTYESI